MTASTRPSGLAGAAMLGVLGLAAAIFVAVVLASIHRTPGIGGVLTGIFTGAFTAGLFAVAGGFAVVKFATPAPQVEAPPPGAGPRVDGTLEQTLAELEQIRLTTKAQIAARCVTRVPLCVVGAVVLWIAGQFSSKPSDLFDLFIFAGIAAGGGYIWASSKLSEAYRRLYKERVLPQLAAQFGDLTYRVAVPALDELRSHHLVDAFDASTCEDEICGQYRGLPLSIIEVRLTHGSGKERRTVFDGLLTTVTLPRSLKGTTVVSPDRGRLGNWMSRSQIAGCQPVRIEDPTFEKAYEVYATDQISARALLTPAFMERFLRFAAVGRFGSPLALVKDNRLLITLPKQDGRNLFEPPSYREPAAGRKGLEELSADIQAVLSAADAVIDLDQASRAQATSPGR